MLYEVNTNVGGLLIPLWSHILLFDIAEGGRAGPSHRAQVALSIALALHSLYYTSKSVPYVSRGQY